ncbi:MAG TPA: sugar phosphate nucleotidyltransferase [Candidatus Paceibacterota bacterium]|nr:sugar phosphate nucleotidyltransferase [Candidatus Paceibacterota bacterium]
MQCVILAAGKGTRLRPLTDSTPKTLVKVSGKPILQHTVEALPSEITEIILVVGYLEEQIRNFCGTEFFGKKIKYVTQENPAGGTGEALNCAKELVKGKFLLLNGDDIYGAEALKIIIKEESAVFGVRSDTPERFGVLIPDAHGFLKQIIEKPKIPPSNLINIGGYVLDDSIFRYEVGVSELGEVFVTDIVTAYAQNNQMKIIEQDLWLPIGYPEDIDKAEKILKAQSDSKNSGA